MTDGFVRHLDDLIERTDATSTHLRELLNALQRVSEPNWDREHAWEIWEGDHIVHHKFIAI
jgi:hypothetical protein